MVTTVVTINTIISLIILFITWRVWRLRRRISKIANALTNYERKVHNALYPAPQAISKGEKAIHKLREKNQLRQRQIQQVRQVFRLLLMGIQIWRRYNRRV